jgi:hypothetical protein
MNLMMVAAAERNRELVADFATECPALRKAQMMGIRGQPATSEARLSSNALEVIPITDAARFWQSQNALIDRFRPALIL